MRRLLLILVALVAASSAARATTYYVDPATGSNAQNGTSSSTPWLNPPGTHTAGSATAYWSSTWEAGASDITTSHTVACGDTILLKGGSTQNAAQGGAWLIGDDYYTDGCDIASAPITLRIATSGEWSGSSGAFTVDATGVTGTYGDGWSDHAATVVVTIDGVKVLGLSGTERFIVQDSSASAFTVMNQATTQAGFRGEWWLLQSSDTGFNIGNYTNWQVSNSVATGIDYAAWQTGINNDHDVIDGAFVDVVGHDSGCGSSANPGCTNGLGFSDVFFLVGGVRLWCVRCTAYNGGERGFNTGVVQDASMGGDFLYRFRDIVSYKNGATCGVGGHNCSAAGWDISGNDNANADRCRNYVMGARIGQRAKFAILPVGYQFPENVRVQGVRIEGVTF